MYTRVVDGSAMSMMINQLTREDYNSTCVCIICKRLCVMCGIRISGEIKKAQKKNRKQKQKKPHSTCSHNMAVAAAATKPTVYTRSTHLTTPSQPKSLKHNTQTHRTDIYIPMCICIFFLLVIFYMLDKVEDKVLLDYIIVYCVYF